MCKMMAMETTLSSNNTAVEMDKPRTPRFEAYVMTGDAILNLSRTTHSPEFFPIHSKTKKNTSQTSSSVPTSPCESIFNGTKPWEPPSKSETNQSMQCSSPVFVKNSRSEDALHACLENELKTQQDEERTLFCNTLLEPAKENDRIVWTYNAPLTEQEIRKLEANEFWLRTKEQSCMKQIVKNDEPEFNQTVKVGEKIEVVREVEVLKTEADEGQKEIDEVGKESMFVIKQISSIASAKENTEEEIVTLHEEEDVANSMAPVVGPTPSTEEDSDGDSLQSVHYSPKGVDMPSAIRLAKRLFTLDGFQKSDVSRHLSKNNDFNRVVAEEYLKHFNFENASLDEALRTFLQAFQLTGESSERDRVLIHFSRRYLQCNHGSFSSQDGVHILTCALLLLNSDLHGKHLGLKRMTCAQFVKRLTGLNDGGNFPTDLLRRLYNSIKEHPLEWASDTNDCPPSHTLEPMERTVIPKEIPSNPYLDIPAPSQSREFKKGYIMRKCCMEPNGKRTTLGKRGWKMYFAVLKDLVLYLYKDEATCKGELPPRSSGTVNKKSGVDPGPTALIRVHHALAANAPDYTKKQNVFRLFTADRAQYLIQASDTKEWRCWMDAINTAAALLSAQPLAAPVGSQQRFQRPLLPASLSKFSPREQLLDHEARVRQLEHELREHRAQPLPKNAKTALINMYREKDAFLHYEKTRYEAYTAVLQGAFGTSVDHDLSLIEMDERSDSGAASPDLKTMDSEDTSVS